jgi:formate hydrogenlyase transcriptional activator
MIVSSGPVLEIEPQWLPSACADVAATELPASLAEIERRAIVDALQRCQGRIYGARGAAAALGLKPTTLYGKMRKLRIARPAQDDRQ